MSLTSRIQRLQQYESQLANVRGAADHLRAAEESFNLEISEAIGAGVPGTLIAEAAGVSYQSIYRRQQRGNPEPISRTGIHPGGRGLRRS